MRITESGLDELTNAHIKIQKKLGLIKKNVEEKQTRLTEMMGAIESEIRKRLKADGLTEIETDNASAILTSKRMLSFKKGGLGTAFDMYNKAVEAGNEEVQYCVRNMFTARVKKEGVEEWEQEYGKLPEFVSEYKKEEIKIKEKK